MIDFHSTLIEPESLKKIVGPLVGYFHSLRDPNNEPNSYTIIDPDTALPATCCTQVQVAALFALDHLLNDNDSDRVAQLLTEDASLRQNPNGSFSSSYNQPLDAPDLQDIAEIGASANALYYVHQITNNLAAKKALVASAEYILTQVSLENPGAIYKSSQARHVDVLNGDVYAALTLSRAYELTGDDRFLDQTRLVINHVQSRFGAWKEGWWPYAESWDGQVAVGASLAYQATIIAFGMPICRTLEPGLRTEWSKVLSTALKTVAGRLAHGPSDDSEAPSWSRDWANVWEIPLAFAQFPYSPYSQNYVRQRLLAVEHGIEVTGIETLRPKALQNDGRTPVTSLYRKAATFAGFLSDILLNTSLKTSTPTAAATR
ncbi:hypothetical protein RI444_16980 [Paenarthrobacter sp. AT5]|uniref:hypothetical protein n=1 Tax=Paenarthrobacter TaxID=1742992 RepID=UPI001A998787|nr:MULTISPECIES: hypothetical protein [Paenarthrobacter]QSZ52993.1 hypothetical protein AYX19_08300 [Paenarthrobacter ureafaciens]WOC60193.1 hypothetical protein RI444_16980 [Paenarthrobacter sp. AT5]